jgi:hypothetical protein
MNGLNKPEKKVLYREKVKDDFAYCKDWIKWCISASRWHATSITSYNGMNINAAALYEIANGRIPADWFKQVTNAFNYGDGKELPAKIDDFNLVYPSLQYLEGKKIELLSLFNYQVENMSSEFATKQQEELNKFTQEELLKVFNEDEDAAQGGVELEKKTKEFLLSYKDNKALRGQDILDVIIREEDFKEKIIECFRHWNIVGEAIMYMNVEDDRINILPISPLYVSQSKISYDFKNRYLQDQDWICVRYYWSSSEILDKFRYTFTDKQIDELEHEGNHNSRFALIFGTEYLQERYRSYNENIECIHCQWTVYKKIGKVTYPNPLTGEMEEMEVGEDFKLDSFLKDQGWTIEWTWVTEKWEGWEIAGKHHIGIRPLPVQNGKLNYYGRKYSNLHSANTSVVQLSLPYVKLFCVLWFHLEKAVQKTKGKMLLLPIQAVAGGEGREEWDFKEALYTAESLGIMLYDMSNPALQGQTLNNIMGTATVSQAEEAMWLMQMLEYIKKSWLDMIGINPSSLAQNMTDKGLGVMQTEIYQSSVITEPIFSHFEFFEEKLLQSILDYSQYAYINGKSMTVIRDDNSVAFLEVDGIDHLNSEYGVFVTKSRDEAKRLDESRKLALDLASQGQDPAKLIEMVYAKNSSKLKEILYELKNKELEIARQTAKDEETAKQETIQMQQAFKQFEVELDIQRAGGIMEAEFPYKKELELIKLEANQLSFQGETDSNANGIPDVNEVEKRSNERLKMGIESTLKLAELKLKNKEIETKERIENKKAEVSLKNKVVGEK